MIAHASPVEHGVVIVSGAVALIVYGAGWLRQRSASTWRLASATVGVAAFLSSVSPTVEVWSQDSFAGHMVQHLMMIVVAAPAIVLSRPVRTVRTSFAHHHTSAPARRVARWWRTYGAPLSAACFVGILFATHLSDLYDLALRNRFVHDAEHLAYLFSAIALWSALLSAGRRNGPARIASVFAVIGGSAFLGVVLISATRPLVPTYAARLGIEAAVRDQRVAASMMWVAGMATTLPLLLVVVWRWAAAEERIAQRTEALGDAHSEGATTVT